MTLFATPPSSPTRTLSGFGLLSKIKSQKENNRAQQSSPRLERPVPHRYGSDGHQRASSSILFSIPAEQGAGLKSRRLSLNPPEDGSPLLIVVDTCELDDEFVSASKFGWKKEVGKGASATVKIMVRKSEKKKNSNECFRYAVKEFRKKSSRETEDEYVSKVKSEYAIAKSLDHPNIVRTVRLCTHAGRWNHVMEYCQQGELFSLVDRRYLKSDGKQCIFKQVLRGVSYLHDNGIAHRDIKLENLLMTESGHVKITDFGVSDVFCGDHPGLPSSHGLCGQQMKEIRKATPGICGSKPYISPEVLAKDKEYDPTKLDVWSCGILYLTLVLGGNPWQVASPVERTYKDFIQGWNAFLSQNPDGLADEISYPRCGSILSKALSSSGQRRCILRMLNPHPAKRCTIREALMDRWMKKIECCCPETNQPLQNSNGLDVSKIGCSQVAAKMKILPRHDHLPPENTTYNKIPKPLQHRFDMGDGTSRYD